MASSKIGKKIEGQEALEVVDSIWLCDTTKNVFISWVRAPRGLMCNNSGMSWETHHHFGLAWTTLIAGLPRDQQQRLHGMVGGSNLESHATLLYEGHHHHKRRAAHDEEYHLMQVLRGWLHKDSGSSNIMPNFWLIRIRRELFSSPHPLWSWNETLLRFVPEKNLQAAETKKS